MLEAPPNLPALFLTKLSGDCKAAHMGLPGCNSLSQRNLIQTSEARLFLHSLPAQDRERGVVWEETIIFLPDECKMVSPAVLIFSHKQPCAYHYIPHCACKHILRHLCANALRQVRCT